MVKLSRLISGGYQRKNWRKGKWFFFDFPRVYCGNEKQQQQGITQIDNPRRKEMRKEKCVELGQRNRER